MIYLYVKTQTKTGLRYLGKTIRDPFTYKGSGRIWKVHLSEHGDEHETEIIKVCESKEELNKWGRYYSSLWNVVDSLEWANSIPETGGGWCSSETAKIISTKLRGRKKPPRKKEHTENQARTIRGRSNPLVSQKLKEWYESKPDLSEAIRKQSESIKKTLAKKSPEEFAKSGELTWHKRYMARYNEYAEAIKLLNDYSVNQVSQQVNLDYATVRKLNDRTHSIFKYFPELDPD